MGETFSAPLADVENVDVMLNANLVEIITDETARTVTGFDVRTLDGRRFTFLARYYVVAAGGIENARLLLASNRVQTEGLGNGRGSGWAVLQRPCKVFRRLRSRPQPGRQRAALRSAAFRGKLRRDSSARS